MVFAYQAAERHWNEVLYHGWTFWELKESGFVAEKLDREHKGFISVEDLTFYINTEVGGEYRNRDLMLILCRLRGRGRREEGHRVEVR